MRHSLIEILAAVEIQEIEAKVYISLLKSGPTRAGSLARTNGVTRSSLYGILSRLIKKGLVSESTASGVKLFIAEEPEKINFLLQSKADEIGGLKTKFRETLPALKQLGELSSFRPKLSLFEGTHGLQSALKDMLLYYDLSTFALWPIAKMLKVLSPEFFRFLNRERIRNNLFTRAIWPYNHGIKISEHPYLGVGDEFKREIRIAPKNFDFPMGYWSYGSRTAFISSERENFGFVIESNELAETLKVQFEVIWSLSSPLVVNKKESQGFLEEIKLYR